jgi:hypothetical protein
LQAFKETLVAESQLQSTEANIQATVVSFLSDLGWHIVSTVDTASKERGVSFVAERAPGRR